MAKVKKLGVYSKVSKTSNGSFSTNTFKCLGILDSSERRKLTLLTLVQIFLSIFDLIGVALLGVLGSVISRTLSNEPVGDRTAYIFAFLRISSLDRNFQVLIIGLLALIFFALKLIISGYLQLRSLLYLGSLAANFSTKLLEKLIKSSIHLVKSKSLQEQTFALTSSVTSLMMGVIASFFSLIVDIISVIVLIIALGKINISSTLAILLLFVPIGLIMNVKMREVSRKLSEEQTTSILMSQEQVTALYSGYKEIVPRGSMGYFIDEFAKQRSKIAVTTARIKFLPIVSKYVYEIMIIIGILIVANIQFSELETNIAIGSLTFFLAGLSRLAPAILRIQSGMLTMQSNLNPAIKAVDLWFGSKKSEHIPQESKKYFAKDSFIVVRNLSVSYDKNISILEGVNLEVEKGAFVGIIGKSGAGKTSLVDTLLGINVPKQGEIYIENSPPNLFLRKNPGAVSYVPQDVTIIRDSIRNNLIFGATMTNTDNSTLLDLLKLVEMHDFIKGEITELDRFFNDSGFGMSAGQKQRIGLARSLLTKPKILILDEALNALDSQTATKILSNIKSEYPELTLLLLTHRKEQIELADIVFEVKGKSIAIHKR